MGLGSIRKLRGVLKGGLRRKIGKLLGKVDGRLGKVLKFIFKLKISQINRIAGSTSVVAAQASAIGGAIGTLSGPVGYVAGGLSSVAGSLDDVSAQANGFLTSLDEKIFRTGRKLYKRCYRILRLCTKVLGTISKFARKIRKIIKIVKFALKIAKFVMRIVGVGAGTKLITKALEFLKQIDDVLLIVQRATGQFAAICRDLSDQLEGMKEKYEIAEQDLSGLESDNRVCIKDRFWVESVEDEFCDPDWDDEIDDTSKIDSDLAILDTELDNIEREIQLLLDRRAPQTKNECLRFLADLDCVDRLDAIVNGLDNINSPDPGAQAIIDRAKANIDSAKTNIETAVGVLDFESVNFPPHDTANAPIIETISGTKQAADSIKGLKKANLTNISKDGFAGVEYNDNKIPEYLNYRKDIDDQNLTKLTGSDFISRYKKGISLREAIDAGDAGRHVQIEEASRPEILIMENKVLTNLTLSE